MALFFSFSPPKCGKPWVLGFELRDVFGGAFPLHLKVLFHYLGQALFGAISLATPPWVDAHLT
jgi:hypothetical protein